MLPEPDCCACLSFASNMASLAGSSREEQDIALFLDLSCFFFFYSLMCNVFTWEQKSGESL